MAKYSKEVVEIECQLKHETNAAYLIVTGEEDKETWIPKSIGVWSPSHDKVNGTIDIPTWLVEKEGLV